MLESILSKTHFHPVIKCNPDNFVAINLSQTNNELSKIDLKNTVEFANYINTYLIKWDTEQEQRFEILSEIAIHQREILPESKSAKRLIGKIKK